MCALVAQAAKTTDKVIGCIPYQHLEPKHIAQMHDCLDEAGDEKSLKMLWLMALELFCLFPTFHEPITTPTSQPVSANPSAVP